MEKKEELVLQKQYPFTWVRGELTYLGVKLTSTVDGLYLANFIPLLNEIKTDLKKNTTRTLSWLGRINAFKMATLPKITYKFQMLPIDIPQFF